MKFAEKYPTEEEVSNVLETCTSWRAVIASLGNGARYVQLVKLATRIEKDADNLRSLLSQRTVKPSELDKLHEVAVAIVYEMDSVVEEIEEMEAAAGVT